MHSYTLYVILLAMKLTFALISANTVDAITMFAGVSKALEGFMGHNWCEKLSHSSTVACALQNSQCRCTFTRDGKSELYTFDAPGNAAYAQHASSCMTLNPAGVSIAFTSVACKFTRASDNFEVQYPFNIDFFPKTVAELQHIWTCTDLGPKAEISGHVIFQDSKSLCNVKVPNRNQNANLSLKDSSSPVAVRAILDEDWCKSTKTMLIEGHTYNLAPVSYELFSVGSHDSCKVSDGSKALQTFKFGEIPLSTAEIENFVKCTDLAALVPGMTGTVTPSDTCTVSVPGRVNSNAHDWPLTKLPSLHDIKVWFDKEWCSDSKTIGSYHNVKLQHATSSVTSFSKDSCKLSVTTPKKSVTLKFGEIPLTDSLIAAKFA